MSDVLKIASWDIVPDIMKVLERNFPNCLGTHNTLKSYWRWKTESTPDLDVHLLAPDGKADDYGTFALYVPGHGNMIVFDTLHPDHNRLKQLLLNCHLIDWSKKISFATIREEFMTIIEEILQIKDRKRIRPDFIGHAFYMEKESALKVTYDCPPEVYVAPLKVEHAELVNSYWRYRGDNSAQFISFMIRYNGGVGVCLKNTNELVAWALLKFYTGPSFLQTAEGHTRKGYGNIAAKAITKLAAEKGAHSICFVHNDNPASQNLFLKIGYNKAFPVRLPYIK